MNFSFKILGGGGRERQREREEEEEEEERNSWAVVKHAFNPSRKRGSREMSVSSRPARIIQSYHVLKKIIKQNSQILKHLVFSDEECPAL